MSTWFVQLWSNQRWGEAQEVAAATIEEAIEKTVGHPLSREGSQGQLRAKARHSGDQDWKAVTFYDRRGKPRDR